MEGEKPGPSIKWLSDFWLGIFRWVTMIRCVRLRGNRRGTQEELWVKRSHVCVYCPYYPQYCVFTARGPCGGLRIGPERARPHSTEEGTELPWQGSVPTCPSLDHGGWSGRG
jgi:hypothetical protein